MIIIAKKALALLEKDEISRIYGLPSLNELERKNVFSIDDREEKVISNLRSLPSKLLFILQLGIFRVKKRFYTIEELEQDEENKKYILQRYFLTNSSKAVPLSVSEVTRLSQQAHILTLFGYKRHAGNVVTLVKQETSRLAKIHSKRSFILRNLFSFFTRERIVIPAYTVLQNLIGMAVEKEISGLQEKLDNILSQEQKNLLDNLLARRENFLYELTCLKRTPKNFTFSEVMSAIDKRKKLEEIYVNMKQIIKKLEISEHNVSYYAQLVVYYTIQKVNQLPVLKRRLLLFCFTHVRYKMFNDYLVKAFLYRVNNYKKEAKLKVIQETYERSTSLRRQLKSLVRLSLLFVDPFYQVYGIKYTNLQKEAFKIIKREQIEGLGYKYLTKETDEKSLEWEQYDGMKKRIRMNLRPLVLALEFEAQPSSINLVGATNSLKNKLKIGTFPKKVIIPDFFSESVNKYVYAKRKLVKLRYEFQIYKSLEEKLVSGDVFIKNSLSYRSFEQDIIDRNYWQENKKQILDSLGLPKLQIRPKDLMDDLEEEFNEIYTSVNNRIIQGENANIEWDRNKRTWKVISEKREEEKLQRVNIFDNMPAIGLSNLLNFVNSQTSFKDAFTHILEHRTENEGMSALLATITACGTNIGLGKMARNANVSFEEIQQTYRKYIRVETLKKACDMVVNSIKEMPIFSQWNIDGERIYSSSDGQKFGVSRETYNARYSSKYFGREKGIVSYTLGTNYLPINSYIIGANEHESHFVLDILLDNTSEIKSNVHTTDSHGSNRVNFALLYFFDYIFAPRYRNFKEEAKDIYCLSNIDKYDNYFLKPKGMVDRELIEQEWDNILRIVASLAMKTTSQSTIIRKLISFPRRNNTYRALFDLNKIIKSIYILRYIDECRLRKHIQKSLNRQESYHSLKRALFYDNKSKFRVSSEVDQNIWSECTRLLALSIIYYNTFVLSQISTRCLKEGKSIDFLKHTSPIQWQHIDMFGHFYFGDGSNETEIKKIFEAIESLWNLQN